MLQLLKEISNTKDEELDLLLTHINESKLFGRISEQDAEFLSKIIYDRQNNIILSENNIVKDKKISSSLAISVVSEEEFNQGENNTTYFKVFKYPSNCGRGDKCYRISIFTIEYTLHKGTYDILLDKDEKKELMRLLFLPYTVKESKHEDVEDYNNMMQILIAELTSYYKANHIKNYELPKCPTVWNAILYYVNKCNNYKNIVSLLLPIPDYTQLPTGETKKLKK